MIDSQQHPPEELPIARRLVLERGADGVVLRFFSGSPDIAEGEISIADEREPVVSILIPSEDMSGMLERLDEQLRLEAERMLPSDDFMHELVRRSPPLTEWTE